MADQEIMKKAEDYLSQEWNEVFKDDIRQVMEKGEEGELRERFYRDLDFGTGGLRGEIGGGYNRMNSYTVAKATQGLATYIVKNVPEEKRSVVISYDSRNYSDLFSQTAAEVLAGNGIKTYLFTSLRPTPVLSFAVRELGTCAGIMVTASHNPAKYNGYKVFWDDGAQVTPPHDKGIIGEVNLVTDRINRKSKDEALADGSLVMINEVVDGPYYAMCKAQCLRPELVKEKGQNLKIVYTPLHGAGTVPVETVLSDVGIKVFTVPEQREPDGDFPTVAFPNPEITPAMDLSLKYAREQKADLVIGTDPDADRIGIAVPDGKDWTLITGNQLGALLTDYIFRSRQELGLMPDNPAFINTIVTTNLHFDIAQAFGATCFKVLTGFKYIGAKIAEWDKTEEYQYIFGGEESYGFLVETDARDKDAVSAALLTAEMALWNVNRGKTVLDHLKEIWQTYGYYEEFLISQYFEGEAGAGIMAGLMKTLRDDKPREWGDLKASSLRDFKSGTTTNLETGKVEKDIDMPSSDVLQFVMTDGSLVTARPSGTEPKIKFYGSCCVKPCGDLEEAKMATSSRIKSVEARVGELIQSVQ
ncbi:MAG: phospho-sugar mutase [Spirochaetales bacterium]|nr:phospho-sugar mutase [Spirochaetales bacterium]